MDQARLKYLKEWQQRYVDQRKFAGSSVLIQRAGHEVLFNAVGLRNIQENLSFDRDTLVRIYSMSKPVTSVALMMLVERGLVHLDAPVSDFIPEFSRMTALIPGATSIDQTEPSCSPTLHQLLTHTSGLSYPFNPGVLGEAMAKDDLVFKADQGKLVDLAADAASYPLAFQPGARWEYSIGIDIIGRVIEVISGRTLAKFFDEEIFAPMGMTETGFSVVSGAGNRFASLYTPLEGEAMALTAAQKGRESLRLIDSYENSPFLAAEMMSGGGGLTGSIDDYMRFAEMLRCRGKHQDLQILAPQTVDFMMNNHLAGDIASLGPKSFAEQPMEGMGFGLGGSVVLDPRRTRCAGSVGDFGWGGMASTFFWVDQKLDLSVVFFTQLSPSSSYPARAELKALVHAAILD